MIIDGREYFVYRLNGDLKGELCVSSVRIHNFGLPQDEKVAQNFYVADDFQVCRLYDFDSNFVAPCQTTVFYFPHEHRLGVYYKRRACGPQAPRLYTVSEQDIVFFEVEPMSKHNVEMEYDSERGLWLTDVFEECDIPYAVGLLSDDDRKLVFKRLDETNDGVDYHKSWQGYFLPELRCDEDLLVFGALLTHGFDCGIHEILANGVNAEEIHTPGEITEIRTLVSSVEIQRRKEKQEFVQQISLPLTGNLLRGFPERRDCASVMEVFRELPDELRTFVANVPPREAGRRYGRLASLEEYFVWALILLTIVHDRMNLQSRVSRMGDLRRTLRGYYQINDNGIPQRWYSPKFVCEGIVHAVLDGIPKEQSEPILRQSVALADSLVARCR